MSIPAVKEFDFIVVGGGTAGNVVAGRLAESPDVSVLVIEAGIEKATEVEAITTPSSAFSLRNSQYDWAFKTTMINRPEYERVEKPNTRGKVLGGSSCLNYYTWIPGSAATFNDWAEFGGNDWTWETCREYLAKPVTYHDDEGLYSTDLQKIGRNGPLDVAHAHLCKESKPFRDALTKAWVDKGEKVSEDIYSGEMHGLTHCMETVYKGTRSTSGCFLRNKPNITILAETISKKINFSGTTATSVTVLFHGTQELTFAATKEIIVSQGVFETPKILMLSGIGPEAQLAAHNIAPVVKSEHVGQNLLDHPIMPYCRRLKPGMGLENHLLRPGYERDGAIAQFRKDRTGPVASGLLELVGLPRIDKYLETDESYVAYKKANGGVDPFGPGGQPHFEIDFVPMFSDAFQWHFPCPAEGNYMTVIVDLLRPLSRDGWVKLRSTDPNEQADININFFSNELDVVAMREGVRFMENVLNKMEGVEEHYPWPMPITSDEGMKRAIMERSQTGFHPCGTARLSQSIEQGVVDPSLLVHGTENLRVIDASVIPVIPDCRIQNSVYMIGEKGADIIKAKYPEMYTTAP
ncbi:alcohol oxidase [Polyplosphaeria fusca]|uniref:Alcohol oxidase n=1 Tax=Polyplosphaeria fusca TaxID=682080 RepID=A0A9P4UYB1_9PLEO|nr:alcohol oxidase [Polyplosphaeria fusca]